MRIIVTGGRAFTDRALVWMTLSDWDSQHGIDSVVQGMANGADRLARQWACFYRRVVINYPANWQTFGFGAGPKRNEAMARSAAADALISFAGGRGTSDMVARAKAHGIRHYAAAWPPGPR
jgi:hypothetical protein